MADTRFTVEHVCLTSEKAFEEIASRLVQQLGRLDPEVMQLVSATGDPQQAKASLQSMAGSSGFILLGTSDHGMLLGTVGPRRKIVQFVLDNPASALELTQHEARTALYTPVRVLLYEDENGRTCLEYDKPTSLVGHFGNDRVIATAARLDEMLADLAAKAME
jgi:uncharacterized protein (DUF302 family)